MLHNATPKVLAFSAEIGIHCISPPKSSGAKDTPISSFLTSSCEQQNVFYQTPTKHRRFPMFNSYFCLKLF